MSRATELHPRRAAADDVEALARLVERAYGHYVSRIGRRPGPMGDDYGSRVADDEVWVIDAPDGGLAGALVLVPRPDHLLLDNVAVDPDHQGRGLGERLLDLAEERATAHGLTAVRLYTHVLMTENQRRYEGRGYAETHRGGPAGLERVFYEKRLTAGRTPPRAP